MRIIVKEYNEIYRNSLSKMIHNLYIEDPEGEPMDDEKIAATINYAKLHPDSLKIMILTDEEDVSWNEENGKVIGYAIIQLIWSNEFGGITANIDEMYVMESARGQGIASEFMVNLHKLIPEAIRFTLEVTPSNDEALKLYERMGFKLAENTTMEKIIGRQKQA